MTKKEVDLIIELINIKMETKTNRRFQNLLDKIKVRNRIKSVEKKLLEISQKSNNQ